MAEMLLESIYNWTRADQQMPQEQERVLHAFYNHR